MLKLSLSHNLEALAARLRSYSKAADGIIASRPFIASVESHIIRVTSDFLDQMGAIGDEPGERTARGVSWLGYAIWENAEGEPEGTRWRLRGKKQSGGTSHEARAIGGKRRFKVRRGFKVRKISKRAVNAAGGKEVVWKHRASARKTGRKGKGGTRYSPTSKMMRDNGLLERAIGKPIRRIDQDGPHKVLVLRAGTGVKYFRAQHQRRPIWFLTPEDAKRIRELLNFHLMKAIREAAARRTQPKEVSA